ncbi:DUF1761 domain-containing protein [Shimia sp. R10_1]|uniref:DUF1761 domain-containing protein n=1 Tax=Shimia sp. R10_1 TaxID=2821095 RepID=UPI001AD9F714|nr:DUF1761 domain-containing protein [Shimia sp. R10_1]MBO9473251.1 DUF1761 domain-containing protein [Shimia sp. R10_1]
MGFVAVIAATVASYVFGSVWYMVLAKPWMAAAEVKLGANGRPANASKPTPYIAAFVCTFVVAGMMRHVFALSGITDIGAGLMSGLGIGLFLATPWIVTNYGFAGRPPVLMLIDGGYATIGCMIIGLVLTLL